MLLHKKERKLKEALALLREQNELYSIKGKIEAIKLDEPIFRGYKKFYVLRDDVANRADASKIQEVLDKTNHTTYCRNKQFVDKKGKPLPHGLRPINKYLWHSSGTVAQEKHDKWIKEHLKYLIYSDRVYSWGCDSAACNSHKQPHYHVRNVWMFDTKVEPHYLTHYTPVDGVIESRIAQIRNKFEKEDLWHVLAHAKGQSFHDYDYNPGPSEIHKRNQEILEGLREIDED